MLAPGRFPHSLVLIATLVVVSQVSTYVLPRGAFETEPPPAGGAAYAEREGVAPLRERLAETRRLRGLSEAELAAQFRVSPDVVTGWELGPPAPGEPWQPGTHIEATVGPLLERWVETGDAPTAAAIAAWKQDAPGRQRVLPGSYHEIAGAAPLPWHAALTSVSRGLAKAADVIFFVFVVGGVIAVLRATGAIDALVGAAIRRFAGRPFLLAAIVTTLLAVGSSLIGMSEEYMPFVPVLVTLCLALRLDAVVAMGIVYVAAGVGYGAAALNPFTVLIAQDVAGLRPGSGLGLRLLLWVVALAVGVHHINRYAARVRRDPRQSLVRDVDYSRGFELPADVALNGSRLAVVVLFAAAIALFVWGVAAHAWHFEELNAVFLGLALAAAAVCRLPPNHVARTFCAGAAEMTTTALLIGVARGIEVVLTEGQVIHTVVDGAARLLQGAGAHGAAVGMLLAQSVCNFFIPSGSGQAYVTMPIMAPLADVLGVSRQTAVLAYQMGDGFTNMIVPTNALLMGMLGLARIPFQRWARFAGPLLLKLYVVAVAALLLATATGYR
jgi:uncharacterized ion transporter superfamily protein YfcC